MAHKSTLIMSAMLFVQALSAPNTNKNVITSTLQTPANLSYSELLYILESRRGHVGEKSKRLSPCARAILGCCKDNRMNEACSESLHCGAFFFDDNPCDEKFVLDALKSAKVFYQQLQDQPRGY
ncbi:unnamed protein product [Chrysodeixis includens]|uniref:Uncharacterized protein n=1 Tax=Chrysodeixis includens TaxID=689277 RepID=A0A9P0BVS8_CHRIL|nr:unnamed protein product [Chrysodeixis includens]